ncbi:hypothetical protein LOAG_15857 [Loa loa]|nr:hypothetical protein LOAG_15857 [Loa loa]EFO12676.2 hypothetical protein LOAG_15857 [Loa loa]
MARQASLLAFMLERRCLKMKYVDTMPCQEIAELLNKYYEIWQHIDDQEFAHNEFQDIRRNDRGWIETIKAIERVFLQLEVIEENLVHSSTETCEKEVWKQPDGILKCISKNKNESWSMDKLRSCQKKTTRTNE